MNLTKNQFELLADLEQNKEVLTQRELAQKLGKALGTCLLYTSRCV